MIPSQCPGCQGQFNLKDEFAGKQARCPNCSTVFPVVAPTPSENVLAADVPGVLSFEPADPASAPSAPESGVFSGHAYGIKQKRIALKEKYYIRTKDNADILFAVRDLKFFQALGAAFAAVIAYALVTVVFVGALIAGAEVPAPAESTTVSGSGESKTIVVPVRKANRKANTKSGATQTTKLQLPLTAEEDGKILFVIDAPGQELIEVSYDSGKKATYDLSELRKYGATGFLIPVRSGDSVRKGDVLALDIALAGATETWTGYVGRKTRSANDPNFGNEAGWRVPEKSHETEESPLAAFGSILALLAAFATGAALYPKRHIRFYQNDRYDSNTAPEFSVIQMKRFEFPRKRYAMEVGGETVAVFEKNVFTNVFRRRWWIELPNGHRFVIKEDSIILSLLRRWLPLIGGLIRTNFVFFDLRSDPEQKRPIGIFKRKLELFDNYLLDLSNDPAFTIPRKVAIAMAVLLDTGEKR